LNAADTGGPTKTRRSIYLNGRTVGAGGQVSPIQEIILRSVLTVELKLAEAVVVI
jgi:hypothetical protein